VDLVAELDATDGCFHQLRWIFSRRVVEMNLVARSGADVGGGAVLVREWEGVNLVAKLDAADGCFRRLRWVFGGRAVEMDLIAGSNCGRRCGFG
jgi:hypothetical protein